MQTRVMKYSNLLRSIIEGCYQPDPPLNSIKTLLFKLVIVIKIRIL